MKDNVARLERDGEPVRLDPDKFNMVGLPRISDYEHMSRALESHNPHQYIADRSGTMNFAGEDGTGVLNAIGMHVALLDPNRASSYGFSSLINFDTPQEALAEDQIKDLLSETSFHAALKHIGYEHLPEYIKVALDKFSARDYKDELSL